MLFCRRGLEDAEDAETLPFLLSLSTKLSIMDSITHSVAGITLFCGVTTVLYCRVTNKTDRCLPLAPLLNPTNLPVRLPSSNTVDTFSAINTIDDLRRLAAQASTAPSPLPPLLPRSFLSSSSETKQNHHTTATSPSTIRVLQFNVLARGLSSPPKNGGFVLSPPACLEFDAYRKYRLLEEILRFSPDVVTLEELDHYQDFFQPLRAKFGYDSVYQPKLDAPGLGIWEKKMKEADKQHQKPFTSDGSGIFWKRNKFTCVKSTSMNYFDPVNNEQWGQVGVAVSDSSGGGGGGGGGCCCCCCC
jgi:hypothetical protein